MNDINFSEDQIERFKEWQEAAPENGKADAPGRLLDRMDPLAMSRAFAADGPALARFAGEFWAFDGTAYAATEYEAARRRACQYLERCTRIVKGGGDQPDQEVPFCPRPPDLSWLLDMLPNVLPTPETMPSWIGEGDELADNLPDPDDLILARNGYFNPLAEGPIKLHPPTPSLFAANPLAFNIDPDAPEPKRWLKFLDEVIGDEDGIQLAQEWVGYCLTADTRQQKALFGIGPKRSGKGTFCRVVQALIGAANCVGPTLGSLATDFGLQPLLGKKLAIISDARLSGRADQAAITERLLSITGEDSLSVPRKYLAAVTGKLPTRIMMFSNEMPRLGDASGALASRFLILPFPNSFFANEDATLTDRLLGELPGILPWGVAGLRRLRERGHFIQPDAGEERRRELEDLSSPVAAFVRACCETKPGASVEVGELYAAWKRWCEEEGREHPGTKQTFGRDLSAAVAGIRIAQPRQRDRRVRVYEGIDLTDEGRIGAIDCL